MQTSEQIAEQAIQASINSGRPVSIEFEIGVHSHLMMRAVKVTDLVRINTTEFAGNSLGDSWIVNMPAL